MEGLITLSSCTSHKHQTNDNKKAHFLPGTFISATLILEQVRISGQELYLKWFSYGKACQKIGFQRI